MRSAMLQRLDTLCRDLHARGYQVIACLWRYDGDDTEFHCYMGMADDSATANTDATLLGTAKLMIAAAVLKGELPPSFGQLPPGFGPLVNDAFEDGWNVGFFTCSELAITVTIRITAARKKDLVHALLDLDREIAVEWSNSVHTSQLVWQEPPKSSTETAAT